MAGSAASEGALASSFQARLFEKLKDRGLIPMSAGVTRPLSSAASYDASFAAAKDEIAKARQSNGLRTADRYQSVTGQSYRDKRFEHMKGVEGLSLKAYPDPSGGTSVALGFHMDRNGARDDWNEIFDGAVDFDDVKSGKTALTTSQAKLLFERDSVYYEGLVDKATAGRSLSQNQRLALFSVAYNAPKRFNDNAEVWSKGTDAEITAAILTKTFAPQNGELLKTRRYTEAALFSSPVEAPKVMPSFSSYAHLVQVEQDGSATLRDNAALGIIDVKFGDTARSGVAFVHQYQSDEAKTRRAPISDKLNNLLNAVGNETGVHFEVYSGGQDEETGFTGSTRHDHGNAADVRAYVLEGGKKRFLDQSNPADQKVWSQIVKLSRAGGATGIGAAEGYMGNGAMHIGFGGEDRIINRKVVKYGSEFVGVWGEGGKAANAPQWLRDAWVSGEHVPPLNIPNVASSVDTRQPSNTASVQQALADRGFSPGKIDGIKGPKTDAAIRAFQKANGLDPDGIVGPKTLAALSKTAPQPRDRPSDTSPSTRVSYGFQADKRSDTLNEQAYLRSSSATTVKVLPDGRQVRSEVAGPPTWAEMVSKRDQAWVEQGPSFVQAGQVRMSPNLPAVMPMSKPIGMMAITETTKVATVSNPAKAAPVQVTKPATITQQVSKPVTPKYQVSTAPGTFNRSTGTWN